MNLNQYKKFYYTDEGHWYLSKIKQYNEKSINEMAHGLLLYSKLLSSNPDEKTITKFDNFKPKISQISLFEDEIKQIRINEHSKLFLSLQILENDLVDLTQMQLKNAEKYEIYLKIKQDFKKNKNYDYFIKKYGKEFLTTDLEVYYRNFYSWLSKFGYFGKYESEICFITEAGYEFISSCSNINQSSAIFLNQIKKLQVWNPTIDKKYKDIKVLPYFAILQILLKLPENYFTRTEYVLFITKTKSHEINEIDKIVNLITKFRKLEKDHQKKYIDSIEKLDIKYFPERERTNYARLSDSSSKEIGAYSFGSLISKNNEHKIKLLDIEKAKREIDMFQKSPQFIEFNTKYDWIRHLGSLNGLTINEIVDLYVNSGKTKEEIKENLKDTDLKIEEKIKERFLEKQIEDYYVKNLSEIDPNLEIVNKPEYGRQFSTHIGIIDLLCVHKSSKEYYVIEFKRSQVSDDTFGQVLRYMGWIYLNMTKAKKTVNAIIVGNEFSDKFHYTFMGVQSNHIYQIIRTFKHPFSEQNKPKLI